MNEPRQSHWQAVYRDNAPTEVSWYQHVPEKSLQLIRATGVASSVPILDVGGGASTLVDHLLAEGFSDISVLDISGKALESSRARLGKRADEVHWIETDVTSFAPSRRYAVWHDRAVFHFLTDPAERVKYMDVIGDALQPLGFLVIATFGPEGPKRCSGLPVQRWDITGLENFLGERFKLGGHELEMHKTPSGSTQQFLYSWWQIQS